MTRPATAAVIATVITAGAAALAIAAVSLLPCYVTHGLKEHR